MTLSVLKRATVVVAIGWMGSAIASEAPPDTPILSRYQRAAEVQQAHSRHWVLNATVTPHWIRGRDQFWYERETPEGHRFTLLEAATGNKSDLFDQARLAQELGKSLGKTINADDLPIKGLSVDPNDSTLRFSAAGKSWRFDRAQVLTEDHDPLSKYAVSPDAKRGIFFKDHNLWVKEFTSGKETRLTSDGEAFYEYGVGPVANMLPTPAPKVVWSPDSRLIFTAQTDDRKVLDAPVVDFAPKGSLPEDPPSKENEGPDRYRPKLVNYRMAFPGDTNVTTFRVTIIEVENGHQTPVRYQTIPAVRMNDTPMDGRMWWSADSKSAYFVDIERGEKAVHVEAVLAATGGARELFSETSDTYVELGSGVYMPAAIRPLPASNQLIWYSERSGWAHLYLYDLTSGKLVRALTHGNWLVQDILAVDETRGQVLISIEGRTHAKSPYYREIARVDIKTGALRVLSASVADHEVVSEGSLNRLIETASGADPAGLQGVAPSGRYIVETVSTADKPSHTVVRDADGNLVATVEDADASRLPSYWRWPQPVQLLAADGKTVINGLVFKPFDYDPRLKYPVIDFIYGGPQVTYVPRNYADFPFKDGVTYAALGFIAVIIDGRGTIERSREFHAQSYRKAESASNVADHIAAIRQLASADPSFDTSRVGITGFSGGGYMTASAMLRFSDFYKVGVAGSGNHDQRLFWNTWGERYEGYPVGEYYKDQANVTYVKGLKGKLLLVHGLLDLGVHPSNVFQLEQALMDANKDFDLLVWPRAGHELPSYGMRRVWDYFVANLAAETPPAQFSLRTDIDIERDKGEELAKEIQSKEQLKPDAQKKD